MLMHLSKGARLWIYGARQMQTEKIFKRSNQTKYSVILYHREYNFRQKEVKIAYQDRKLGGIGCSKFVKIIVCYILCYYCQSFMLYLYCLYKFYIYLHIYLHIFYSLRTSLVRFHGLSFCCIIKKRECEFFEKLKS